MKKLVTFYTLINAYIYLFLILFLEHLKAY